MKVSKNIKTALALSCIPVLMFGFGYLMAPLYSVFCKAVGLNGTTGEISAAEARQEKADLNRVITVQFDANVNGELSWAFRPATKQIAVRPGEINEALFYAENLTDRPITAQAIPSVAPYPASIYFKKTECFCFTAQTLAPHEKKQMPVRFIIDPDLPKTYQLMTLSYTFFHLPESVNKVSDKGEQPENRI